MPRSSPFPLFLSSLSCLAGPLAPRRPSAILAFLLVAGLSIPLPVTAANFTWDTVPNNGANIYDAGSGTWSLSSATWYNDATSSKVWTNGNAAVFAGADAPGATQYTVTVDTSGGALDLATTTPDLVFSNSGYLLTGSAPGTTLNTVRYISVVAGKTATIENLKLSSITSAGSSAQMQILGGGTLIFGTGSTLESTGSQAINFSGGTTQFNTGGSLSASGCNIYIGSLSGGTGNALVVVNGGTLNYSGANLGLAWYQTTSSGTGTLTVQNGSVTTTSTTAKILLGRNGALTTGTTQATINLDGGTIVANQIVKGTPGDTRSTTVFNFNGGTLRTNVGVSSTLRAAFFEGIDTANVRNGGAVFDTNGQTITVGQALVHSTLDGDNANDGGLTKNGSGTLTLSGVSTYTGATKINTGTLTLSSAGTLDNSSGVNVASGAFFNTSAKTSGYTVKGLAGAGTITGLDGQATTLGTGGILAPGDAGVGTLTFDAGNLAMANGTTLSYQIGGTTLAPTSDLVHLTGTGSTVSFTGTQTLLLANIGTVNPEGHTFVIFDAASAISIAGTWIIDYGTTGWADGFVDIFGDNIVLSGLTNAATIPEPSTVAALAGLLALGICALRRNRTQA